VKESYSAEEFDQVRARSEPGSGWDFSRMHDSSVPPWNYSAVVRQHLTAADDVLDVGTGGGERLIELGAHFGRALAVDADPGMIDTARLNAAHLRHITFAVGDATLGAVSGTFDVILNRQAPYDLAAASRHLRPGGRFITQQVGERNMRSVMEALGRPIGAPPISRADVTGTPGLDLVSFDEYDIEYVVHDLESLVFWLRALDLLPSEPVVSGGIHPVHVLNRILAGQIDGRGFVTNEHRYLVLARRTEAVEE
jgi:SAM-dependent methyltransferase